MTRLGIIFLNVNKSNRLKVLLL